MTVPGVSFSRHFGLDSDWFKKNAVLNVSLDKDALLFIDPFLLSSTKHKKFSRCATKAFKEHFEGVLKLVNASKVKDDLPWKVAKKRLQFSETGIMSGTCLGYSEGHTRGHGFGEKLAAETLETAKQIVDLGVDDPELFTLLPLFNEGIGPDLISDMTTNVVMNCILDFNSEILLKIEKHNNKTIPKAQYEISSDNIVELPMNPFDEKRKPVLLVPSDILKNLPILNDIRELPDIANSNQDLRDRVNKHISDIWKIRTKKDKEYVKSQALESKEAFLALLELVKKLESLPYDISKDPDGIISWRSDGRRFATFHPLEIKIDKSKSDLENVEFVVGEIIEQFRQLIENQRMSRIIYVDGEPRKEKYAQLLFQCIAAAYCEANNLDISPEADAGAGPVDFKFSRGKDKVVVEVKLSSNQKVVHGYDKQLKAYQNAEASAPGYYLLIDVGRMGDKWKKLQEVAKSDPNFGTHRRIVLVDANIKPSASNLLS